MASRKSSANWERHLRDSLEPMPPGYERVVYGTARTAKTEGDLYESIVGRRSAVLDARDAKDAAKGRR